MEPERLRPLAEIMQRSDDGRWQQTAKLARGGGASILIALSDWVLEALDAPDQRGRQDVRAAWTPPRFWRWGRGGCSAGSRRAPRPRSIPRRRCPTACPDRRATRSTSGSISTTSACATSAATAAIWTGSATDIREDFCGEHGLAQIDRRIHSVHPVWSGGVLSLWVCWRTARELPHRGGLPRRLAARQRWRNRRHEAVRDKPPARSPGRRVRRRNLERTHRAA